MLPLRIALRYLFSKKSHSAVNIISYVSMAGVAFASAAMVIVLSVFNGFSDFTGQKMSRFQADLIIEPIQGKTIANADSIAGYISEMPDIASVSPVIIEKAFATIGERQTPLTIKGISTGGASTAYLIDLIIDGGVILEDSDRFTTAIASVGLANTLRCIPSMERSVKIYEPKRQGRINPSNPMGAFRADSVFIAGVYRTDQTEWDDAMLIVPIETTRHLLDYQDEASAIEVRLRSGADLPAIKESIQGFVGGGMTVKDRIEQQEHAFKMIKIEKWVTLLMLTFILLIASFNILSTMSMLIVEKQPNMAVMKAIGADSGMVRRIFSSLSLLISMIGGIAGIILGTALSLAQQAGGFIKLSASDPGAMAITAYPVRVAPSDILIVIAIAIGIGLITSSVTHLTLRR